MTPLSRSPRNGGRRLRLGARRAATIRDIALAAGVSIKTVSRVINNEPHVREEKRTRVRSAIRRRRYVPQALAQEFATGATRVVGLCFLHREKLLSKEYYFSEIFEAAHHALDESGYFSLLVSPEQIPAGPTEAVLDVARARKLAGVLLADLGGCDHPRIAAAGFPAVVLSRRICANRIASVIPANADGLGQAVRHLHSLGHRRIGFFGDSPGRPSNEERRQGFVKALAELGLPPAPEWIIPCPSEAEDRVLEAIQPFLAAPVTQRPTALCCVTDLLAVALVKALARHSLRVPHDVSVTGFDDEDFSHLVTPTLTTVRVPKATMGALAAQALLKMIQENGRGEILEVPVELIVRDSTCPPTTGAS